MSDVLEVDRLLDTVNDAWVPATQLNGELFVAGAAFAQKYHDSWQWWRRLRCAATDRDGYRTYRRWIAELPTVRAVVPAGPAGDEARFWLEQVAMLPSLRDGRGISLLPLPADLAGYRRGRSRQALRTNVTKAEKLGLIVHRVSAFERRVAAQEMLARRQYKDIGGQPGDWMSQSWRPNLKNTQWFAVRQPDGQIVSLGVVLVCGDLAFLVLQVAALDVPESSPARYLMHQTVVDHAIRAGAKVLVAESTIVNDAGLHKYQGLLGFKFANLDLAFTDQTEQAHRPAVLPVVRDGARPTRPSIPLQADSSSVA